MRLWHEFQHWNTEGDCQRAWALTWGVELCKHLCCTRKQTTKIKTTFDIFIHVAVRTDIALNAWVCCVSCCWLEGSNSGLNVWVNTAVKQSLKLEEQQTTGNWSLFLNACYATGEKWSISSSLQFLPTRQIFPLIKSTNKQKKPPDFPYPTPSSVHETQDQTNP